MLMSSFHFLKGVLTLVGGKKKLLYSLKTKRGWLTTRHFNLTCLLLEVRAQDFPELQVWVHAITQFTLDHVIHITEAA